ncbi:type I-E CRISPR-associated protein Cse2/CasB [Azospirillum soli]|uniref:type I-E CRISPR-associated protein Cse2/CasB n=1 Tax=Azospirillum soli TaxID=1304799 RepID=UPI001AE201BC|nr:type I-E CRISPR-associated protein Cse2/CasB [Azospirillum soli]MBP2315539.1 CRISPR type I-E-associated protein CasB/Cse2 [Azospirillum soli]
MSTPLDSQFKNGVLLWHQWLTGRAPDLPEGAEAVPKPGLPKDGGARSAMARCRTVADALLAPPFAQFVRYVLPDETERKAFAERPKNLAALARAAVAVGQVGAADLRKSFPEQMAEDAGGGRPRVSRVVAHGLLSTENADEALYHAVQIIATLREKANVVDLAHGMMLWPKTRSGWAYRYNDAVLGLAKPVAPAK